VHAFACFVARLAVVLLWKIFHHCLGRVVVLRGGLPALRLLLLIGKKPRRDQRTLRFCEGVGSSYTLAKSKPARRWYCPR
jgi:hypothetical protein